MSSPAFEQACRDSGLAAYLAEIEHVVPRHCTDQLHRLAVVIFCAGKEAGLVKAQAIVERYNSLLNR